MNNFVFKMSCVLYNTDPLILVNGMDSYFKHTPADCSLFSEDNHEFLIHKGGVILRTYFKFCPILQKKQIMVQQLFTSDWTDDDTKPELSLFFFKSGGLIVRLSISFSVQFSKTPNSGGAKAPSLKVAFYKKVLMHLSYPQTYEPFYFPSLKFWILVTEFFLEIEDVLKFDSLEDYKGTKAALGWLAKP